MQEKNFVVMNLQEYNTYIEKSEAYKDLKVLGETYGYKLVEGYRYGGKPYVRFEGKGKPRVNLYVKYEFVLDKGLQYSRERKTTTTLENLSAEQLGEYIQDLTVAAVFMKLLEKIDLMKLSDTDGVECPDLLPF